MIKATEIRRGIAIIMDGNGRWAERRLRRGSWDVVHAWSGIAEETFRSTMEPTEVAKRIFGPLLK